jgi:hypothetical protein
MILLVDRSGHEMFWLPDGEDVPDWEIHTIQSPKLMLTFVWNPHGFHIVDDMPCHAMPCRKERWSRLPTIFEIFSPRSLHGVERGERMLVGHGANARPDTAQATRAFCDDNFLRTVPNQPYLPDLAPSDFFLHLVWESQKPSPRTTIRVCI